MNLRVFKEASVLCLFQGYLDVAVVRTASNNGVQLSPEYGSLW